MSAVRIHCIQHSERVRPVEVADWAADRGHELVVVRIDRDEPLPSPLEVQALVVLGGEMNTDERHLHPWLDLERAWLAQVVRGGAARVLGICLGSQLLAEVLGGAVTRAARQEIGWHRVELTLAGRAHPALGGVPHEFDVFEWHGDTWSLPPGAELVATGAPGSGLCPTQAFAFEGRVFGVQFHPEFSYERTRELAASTTDDLSVGGLVQSSEEFLRDAARFRSMRADVLDALLDGVFVRPSEGSSPPPTAVAHPGQRR